MPEEINVDFPSNSKMGRENASKRPSAKGSEESGRKIQEKVIQGEVIHRKKPLGRKIADAFTGDDARSVGNYVLMDVLIPAAKNMIADAVSQGAERMMFGDSRPRRAGSAGGRTNYSSYGRTTMSTRPSSGLRALDEGRDLSRRARNTHDFREIVCATRGEAETILAAIGDTLDEYGMVTVADFYGAAGVTGSFVDNKWGWDDLRSASIQHVREGYLIDLPKPFALN